MHAEQVVPDGPVGAAAVTDVPAHRHAELACEGPLDGRLARARAGEQRTVDVKQQNVHEDSIRLAANWGASGEVSQGGYSPRKEEAPCQRLDHGGRMPHLAARRETRSNSSRFSRTFLVQEFKGLAEPRLGSCGVPSLRVTRDKHKGGHVCGTIFQS